jgi:hypothetical protein
LIDNIEIFNDHEVVFEDIGIHSSVNSHPAHPFSLTLSLQPESWPAAPEAWFGPDSNSAARNARL